MSSLTVPDDGRWFLDFRGRRIFPFAMRPEYIDIADIAHSLSNTCRFAGRTSSFYSVAQHSVIVAENLPPILRRPGLLHDATEAYVGDMIRPIKKSMFEYVQLEDEIWRVVATRFDLPAILPPEVHVADNRALMTERRDLLPAHAWQWFEDQAKDGSAEPYPEAIVPWHPDVAKRRFMEMTRELGIR